MQLFIGRLSDSLRYDDIYRYFDKFGKILELKLRNTYGFLTFDDDVVAEKILGEEHVIEGCPIHVEVASSKGVGVGDRFGKRERSPSERYAYRSSPSRGYGRRRGMSPVYGGEYVKRRRAFSPKWRSPCEYCDRCERHGRRYALYSRYNGFHGSAYAFSNKLKIVLDDVPSAAKSDDLIDLAKKYGFEPTFARVTAMGHHGVIEFSSVDEKEEALRRLDKVEFMGNVVTARRYFSRELMTGDSYRPKRGRDDERGIYDGIGQHQDDADAAMNVPVDRIDESERQNRQRSVNEPAENKGDERQPPEKSPDFRTHETDKAETRADELYDDIEKEQPNRDEADYAPGESNTAEK